MNSNEKQSAGGPMPVSERDNLDLLELVCQLHSRALNFPSKDMHDAYIEARKELESRLEPIPSLSAWQVGEAKSKEEIKDAYAVKYGYNNWVDYVNFIKRTKPPIVNIFNIINGLMDSVIEEYKNQSPYPVEGQTVYREVPVSEKPKKEGTYIALRSSGNWSDLYWSGKAWKEYKGRADRKDYTDVTKYLEPITLPLAK